MTPAAVPSSTAPPPLRLDAAAQLMLLLAREKLSDDQKDRARHLTKQVSDWAEFTRFSVQNRSIGFAFKHLSAMPKALFPAGLLAAMQAEVRHMAMAQMALTASMKRFHAHCVAPLNVDHVYIKGPALAGLYYQQPILRPCSDVDILVSTKDFARVARAALNRGDRFLFPSDPPDFDANPTDIDFMIRHSDVIMSFDTTGTLFEIHRHMEKTTPIFPEADLIRSAQLAPIGEVLVPTLSTAWQFIYICYHHSRHCWSKLHWVADLHALQAHPSFDRAEIVALARSIGLAPTVEAALEFAYLTDKPDLWESHLGVTPAGMFLDACLRGLPGDSVFEIEEWHNSFLLDFVNPWQYEPGHKYRLWMKSALRRLQPNCYQYAEKRRSKVMEWLYYVENAATLAGNALKRVGS